MDVRSLLFRLLKSDFLTIHTIFTKNSQLLENRYREQFLKTI